MYLDYWGLKEKPFENTANPKFLYPSKQHREGLRKLLYTISESKGCSVLSGEYGCGKTQLIRTLVSNLGADHYAVALVNQPLFERQELLEEVLFQFAGEAGTLGPMKAFRELSSLFVSNQKQGKSNILIIDEAQIIRDPEVYEELRLLLNLQLHDRFLLSVLLIGQPALREQLLSHPQFDQRVAVKFHLQPFDQQDSVLYVRHRLEVAGCERGIFPEQTLHTVYTAAGGIPRRINTICDLCLFEGATRKVREIDDEVVSGILRSQA